MKKAFVAILAFIYLGITTGVAISMHYCMGKIASVEYGYNEQNDCSFCGMKDKDGCCHDELKIVKLDDSHQLSKANQDFFKAPVLLPERFFLSNQSLIPSAVHYLPTSHSPPDPADNPIYLRNRVFRI